MDISKFHTVDWVADSESQNKARLARSKNVFTISHFLMACRSWLVLALSGAVIGAIAVVLTLSTSWLADLREGHCGTSWYLNESSCCLGQEDGCTAWVQHHWAVSYLIYVFLSVMFAVSASYLVSSSAPLAAGSGISEIKCIVQGFNAPKFLDKTVLVVKCLTLPLVIASGLSVGKEGPSVHYAACVGNIFASKLIKQDFRKRSDIIIACCAAGVAVAFGSPIGGLLFGIEEMAASLSVATIWRTYFCCLVATSVVAIFNPFRTGQLVLFSVEYNGSWHGFEMPFLVILGVFGGLCGRLIIKYNLRVSALRKKFWGQHFLAEAFVLSVLTAAVCYFNTYLRVDMTKSMQILFHECEHGGESHASCSADHKPSVILALFIACCLRTLLLLVSYGAAKVPAGIFVPSLAIGALFGRLVGMFVWMLHDKFPNSRYFSGCPDDGMCINPGAYALLGAGALLSGVMHITLTVVVVMFELTGAINYIVPTMVVVGVTKLIASQIGEGGIADMAIKQNHLPFVEPEVPTNFSKASIKNIMLPADQCSFIRDGEGIPRDNQKFKRYPILDSNLRLIGATSGSKVDKSPVVVTPDESIDTVNSFFRDLGPHSIYITSKDGTFLGLVTRKGLIEALGSEEVQFTPFENKMGSAFAKILHSVETFSSKVMPTKFRR